MLSKSTLLELLDGKPSKKAVSEIIVASLQEGIKTFVNAPIECCQPVPFIIGKSYFIRTVTYHLTGRVKQIVGKFLVLEDAAWIADSGRFANAIKNGNFNEVEPVEDAIVNMDAVSDAFEIRYKLPRSQK